MKVLLINGSTKGERSNPYRFSEAFLSGMDAQEVRERILSRMDIKPCPGCLPCWNKKKNLEDSN